MYKLLIRPVFFLFNAELIHNISFILIKFIFRIPILSYLIKSRYNFSNALLEINVFGLNFKNKIGMAAGFDKMQNYLMSLNFLVLVTLK